MAADPTKLKVKKEFGRQGIQYQDDHPQAGLAARQMSGPGTVVSFEIDGGKSAAFRALRACSDSPFKIEMSPW